MRAGRCEIPMYRDCPQGGRVRLFNTADNLSYSVYGKAAAFSENQTCNAPCNKNKTLYVERQCRFLWHCTTYMLLSTIHEKEAFVKFFRTEDCKNVEEDGDRGWRADGRAPDAVAPFGFFCGEAAGSRRSLLQFRTESCILKHGFGRSLIGISEESRDA